MAASVVVSSSTSSSTGTRLGEVIATNTTGFTAESDALHQLPDLGALVRVRAMSGSDSIYGVVAFGATGGLDASRRAVRRGGEGFADEHVFARHPELELVLRTVFDVAVIGHARGSQVRHTLPPLPVPLHYNVIGCTLAEVERFVSGPRYLPALLSYRGEISPEQLLGSHLAWVDRTLADDHVWLRDAARRLARLMKRDYDQFVTIMQAVDPG
jgi:hypothetical protein